MPGGVGVEPPAPLPPVLQLVSLGKLLALTAPVPAVGLFDVIFSIHKLFISDISSSLPAHGLGCCDPVVGVEVDLKPLPHPGGDGLGGTPGSTLQILSGSAK